jgi:hypothetical protein
MIKYGGISDALDFKFDGEIVANTYSSFTVSILGLTLETINKLTAWNPVEVYGKKRRIRVYAGYEHDGIENPIFEGLVIEAIPTNPPEMWLNFKCIINIGYEGPLISYDNPDRRTLGDIWNDIAKVNNYSGARWESTRIDKNKRVVFSFDGKSAAKLIYDFTHRFDVIGLNINDVLVCKDKRMWSDPKKPKEIISTKTGLLGIAGVSVKGATIRRRLSDTAACSDCVYLMSEVIPKANGPYTIIKKRHVGHFRGKDWYTELELIRAEVK